MLVCVEEVKQCDFQVVYNVIDTDYKPVSEEETNSSRSFRAK